MKLASILFFSCIVVFGCTDGKITLLGQPENFFSLTGSYPAGYRSIVNCISGDTVGFAVPTDTNKIQLDYYIDFNSELYNPYCLSFTQTIDMYDTKTGNLLTIQEGQTLRCFRLKISSKTIWGK